MKRLFTALMIIAVAAMTSTSCSKDGNLAPQEENRMVTATITAGDDAILLSEAGTRTVYDGGKIKWSAADETLRVMQLADGTASFANTSAYSLDEATGKATFTVSFAATQGTSFSYGAIYPQTASAGGSDPAASIVNLSQVQNPTPASYDPMADLMITRPVTLTEQATSLNFAFGRIISIGKMTVKALGLQSGEFVKTVTFTAPGKMVTGRGKADLTTGRVLENEWGYTSGYKFDNVELRYQDNAVTATQFDAWFTCVPFSLAADGTFKVEIQTSRGTYTRDITIGQNNPLEFTMGHISSFSVDMSTATFVETATDTSLFTTTFGAWSDTSKHVTYDESYDMETTGTSAATIAYAFNKQTTNHIRANSNKFEKTDYEGASGGAFWWAAAGAEFIVSGIDIAGKQHFTLSFGAKTSTKPATDVQAYISVNDGKNFSAVSATPTTVNETAELKVLHFSIPAGHTSCQIKITNKNAGSNGPVIDDVKLIALDAAAENSHVVDFSVQPALLTDPDNGGTLSFAADNGAGEAPEVQNIDYIWEGDNCTFAVTKAAEDTWYTVTDQPDAETPGSGTIVIAPQKYEATDTDRTGTVTISLSKNGEIVESKTITIKQAAKQAEDVGKAYTLQPSAVLKWDNKWNALPSNSMSWTPAKIKATANANPGNWDSNGRGQQFGSGTNGITSMSITGTGYETYCGSTTACGIKSINVSACAKSGTKITIGVSVGGVEMTSANATNTVSGSNAAAVVTSNFTSDTALKGDIVITYTLSASGALYVNKISINE